MSSWIVAYREILTDRTAHWKRHVLIEAIEYHTRHIAHEDIVLAFAHMRLVELPGAKAQGAGPCGTSARDRPHCKLVDDGAASAMSSWISALPRRRRRR